MKSENRKKVAAAAAAVDRLMGKNIPCPVSDPVDGNALMSDLVDAIKKYIVVSDHGAIATALWIINTWTYQEFNRCPLLLINAPERECGKTQLLKLVGKLAHRPIETSNLTMAVLFRLISKGQPTLLIDEADTFMSERAELAGVINDGYERGGVVLRMETVNSELVECAYEVYAPKAMAGITLERHLHDATLSRGIQIPLKRKTRTDKVERLRSADSAVWACLYSRINRFVGDCRESLSKGWSQMPEELSDRQQDNWEPLLTIAACLGGDWYEKARDAALAICVETAPPKSSSNQLLEDIREVLTGYKEMRISSYDLVQKLVRNPDMDWATYNRGEELTQRQLARFLSHYGIKPKTVRIGNSTPKGYEVKGFEDAFSRYLPQKSNCEVESEAAPEVARPKTLRPPDAYS